ncbi:MAG: hypothetical protein ACK5HL_00580 [Bacilli bacterium]
MNSIKIGKINTNNKLIKTINDFILIRAFNTTSDKEFECFTLANEIASNLFYEKKLYKNKYIDEKYSILYFKKRADETCVGKLNGKKKYLKYALNISDYKKFGTFVHECFHLYGSHNGSNLNGIKYKYEDKCIGTALNETITEILTNLALSFNNYENTKNKILSSKDILLNNKFYQNCLYNDYIPITNLLLFAMDNTFIEEQLDFLDYNYVFDNLKFLIDAKIKSKNGQLFYVNDLLQGYKEGNLYVNNVFNKYFKDDMFYELILNLDVFFNKTINYNFIKDGINDDNKIFIENSLNIIETFSLEKLKNYVTNNIVSVARAMEYARIFEQLENNVKHFYDIENVKSSYTVLKPLTRDSLKLKYR